MTRMKLLAFAVTVLALFLTYPLAAQTTTSPISPRSTTPARPGRQAPCWQQAGVSQAAIQRHRQIEERTRSEVEAVCSDSSLTAQQKEQKIHQLHEQAHQQAQSVISPQQEEALKACREKRGEGVHMGGMHGGGGGPCGEMTSPTKP
jgi:hypothetical protein